MTQFYFIETPNLSSILSSSFPIKSATLGVDPCVNALIKLETVVDFLEINLLICTNYLSLLNHIYDKNFDFLYQNSYRLNQIYQSYYQKQSPA